MYPYLSIEYKGGFVPNEKIWPDKPWVKHVHCDGARFHVFSYLGISDFRGVRMVVKCSEKNCIVNAPKEIQQQAVVGVLEAK